MSILVNINVLFVQVRVKSKYPVLVFFFGGSFEVGTADGYTHEYLLDEDIVLVVVQYRLGLLGEHILLIGFLIQYSSLLGNYVS